MEETLDLDRLLEALNRRFRDSGRTQRDLERELGLGHGTLGNILRGTTALRLHHVQLLGKGLGFTLQELLHEVYGSESMPGEEDQG